VSSIDKRGASALASAGVRFVKMHGLGNDFVVIDRRYQSFTPQREEIRAMADRHTGIGFDQLLLLDPPRADGDVAFGIFNADGQPAEQCGNGLRCVALLFYETSARRRREISLESPAGTVRARVMDNGMVTVEMGRPDFAPAALPFEATEQAASYTIEVAGRPVEFGAVSMGNAHVVIRVASAAQAPVAEIGPLLERHPAFPKGTNVGFMEIVDRKRITLRVHERGCGETRACGTGASAAAAVARLWGETDDTVTVSLPGGDLDIAWRGDDEPLWMTGPAVRIYEGITNQ
jgi:diaminopimelate epimerase